MNVGLRILIGLNIEFWVHSDQYPLKLLSLLNDIAKKHFFAVNSGICAYNT